MTFDAKGAVNEQMACTIAGGEAFARFSAEQCAPDEAAPLKAFKIAACTCKKTASAFTCSVAASGECRKVRVERKQPERNGKDITIERLGLSFPDRAAACASAKQATWDEMQRQCRRTMKERYSKDVDGGLVESAIDQTDCHCTQPGNGAWLCSVSAKATCVEHAANPLAYVFQLHASETAGKECAGLPVPPRHLVLASCGRAESILEKVSVEGASWVTCRCEKDAGSKRLRCETAYRARCNWQRATAGDSFN